MKATNYAYAEKETGPETEANQATYTSSYTSFPMNCSLETETTYITY
jgi:hypothetical protein